MFRMIAGHWSTGLDWVQFEMRFWFNEADWFRSQYRSVSSPCAKHDLLAETGMDTDSTDGRQKLPNIFDWFPILILELLVVAVSRIVWHSTSAPISSEEQESRVKP